MRSYVGVACVGIGCYALAAEAQPEWLTPERLAGAWRGTVTIQEIDGAAGQTKPTVSKEVRDLVLLMSAGKLHQLDAGGLVPIPSLTPTADGKLGYEDGALTVMYGISGGSLEYSLSSERQYGVFHSGKLRRLPTGFPAGRYVIVLSAMVAAAQADGSPWDPDSGPDPSLELKITHGTAKPIVKKCRQDDVLVATCLSGTVVDLDEHSTVSLSISDYDAWSSNERIGSTPTPVWIGAPGNAPSKDIALPGSGSFLGATIKLVPEGCVTGAGSGACP